MKTTLKIISTLFVWVLITNQSIGQIACPAPDPLTAVIFTGTTAAELNDAMNNQFIPAFEADHGVILMKPFNMAEPSTPFEVFQFGIDELHRVFYGSGMLLQENPLISEVSLCHSRCQWESDFYGHDCGGLSIFDRFINWVGPIGECWFPTGPLEATGTTSSSDELINSLQVFAGMVMNDASANQGHYQDLTACGYASGMGVGAYQGTVTVNWVNIIPGSSCNTTVDCPDIAAPCPIFQNLANSISTDQTYVTNGYIKSSQIIISPSAGNPTIIYNSASEIELKEDFEVQIGAIFNAFIDGCGQ